MRLKDKAIIVTGGTSGIGAAIATAAITAVNAIRRFVID